MEAHISDNQQARPFGRRQPLADATTRANMPLTPARPGKVNQIAASPPGPIPHHDSLMLNGALTGNTSAAAENKRLSAVASEDQADSKRNSQISQISTALSEPGRRRKTHIGPWQLGKNLGSGGCGRVRLVRHAYTGQFAAAKIISKKTAEKQRAQSLLNLMRHASVVEMTAIDGGKAIPFGIEREVVIMKLLDHPNIVRLYDVWENRAELYLIMENVDGGELFHYITNHRGRLPEHTVVHLFRQIIAALTHCHERNIFHRDIKPENILLDQETFTVKLVDFGMAALQPENKLLTTPCGSPHYAAPEVFSLSPYNGSKADAWSCGVILYVMLTSSTPFCEMPGDGRDLRPLFERIKAAKCVMPKYLSKEAQDLISKILQSNPKDRYSLEQIWEHPFMHKYDSEGQYARLEDWMGTPVRIDQWTLKRREDIDREIFRNLRTLWHSEREDILINKLLSEE